MHQPAPANRAAAGTALGLDRRAFRHSSSASGRLRRGRDETTGRRRQDSTSCVLKVSTENRSVLLDRRHRSARREGHHSNGRRLRCAPTRRPWCRTTARAGIVVARVHRGWRARRRLFAVIATPLQRSAPGGTGTLDRRRVWRTDRDGDCIAIADASDVSARRSERLVLHLASQ